MTNGQYLNTVWFDLVNDFVIIIEHFANVIPFYSRQRTAHSGQDGDFLNFPKKPFEPFFSIFHIRIREEV